MITALAASKNPRLGILLMVAAVATFAAQDGFSKGLAGQYNTLMVVMIRYWAFAGFVILLALRRPEGPRAARAALDPSGPARSARRRDRGAARSGVRGPGPAVLGHDGAFARRETDHPDSREACCSGARLPPAGLRAEHLPT